MARIAIPVVVAIAVFAAAARADKGEVADTRFRSARWGVALDGPNDYERTGDSPYPGILARWKHANGVTLALSAQQLGKLAARKGHPCGDQALGRFVEDNLEALRASDYVVITPARPRRRQKLDTCRVVVAPARDRRAGVRVHQAYLVSGGIGYVLTLTLPDQPDVAPRAADLDQALDRLELATPDADKTPARADPEPPPVQPASDVRLTASPRFPDVKPWLPGPSPQPARKETPLP